MFTDQQFSKLLNTPGVSFSSFKHFIADKRLVNPMSICSHSDCMQQFGEFEEYPDELAEVFYYNGY